MKKADTGIRTREPLPYQGSALPPELYQLIACFEWFRIKLPNSNAIFSELGLTNLQPAFPTEI